MSPSTAWFPWYAELELFGEASSSVYDGGVHQALVEELYQALMTGCLVSMEMVVPDNVKQNLSFFQHQES